MTKITKTLRRWLAVVVAMLTGVALLAGCGGGNLLPASKGTLTVGVRADVVGFGYYNKQTKRYYGMEIDMANDLAKRLGYKDVKFVTVKPENRKDMLLKGKVDMLIACYSISDTRTKNFDFSDPYYTDSLIMVTENSSLIKNVDGLKDHTIGTMSGANSAPIVLQEMQRIGFSNGTVVSSNDDQTDIQYDTWHLHMYSSYKELSDALEEGEVDAMALDHAISKTYMNDERSVLEDFSVNPQEYGVATQKNSDLSKQVKSAVKDMKADGTIDRLTQKWK